MVNSLEEVIRENLGEVTLKRIQYRLHKHYCMSVNQSLLEPEVFHKVLHEFFGSGAEGLEKRIREEVYR